MLRVANRIIVVGSIILVLVLVVGGCVLEDLQWRQMMHPDWPKQETAGAEVDRAVGAAVDRYEAVLDAQWGDADCVVVSEVEQVASRHAAGSGGVHQAGTL